MNRDEDGVALLKTLWGRGESGKWAITGMKSIRLTPRVECSQDYFALESEIELMTSSPKGFSVEDLMSSFGPTSFLLQQSIVPVVALVEDEPVVRVIGTAFFISASGLLMTACHVILDPEDRGYGQVSNYGGTVNFGPNLKMGVMIPLNPALFGPRMFRFAPFQICKFWGAWRSSPLLHQRDRVEMNTDVAVCRVPSPPDGSAYQPLNLSLRGVSLSEKVFAMGYAEMDDIPIENRNGALVIGDFTQELYVSVGETTALHNDNHITRNVPTPGPCFEFRAKVPGKMSGGPILGSEGAVIKGIVSRSFSGERHAFGALLGPAIHLPAFGNESIHDLMLAGKEGIPQVLGV